MNNVVMNNGESTIMGLIRLPLIIDIQSKKVCVSCRHFRYSMKDVYVNIQTCQFMKGFEGEDYFKEG